MPNKANIWSTLSVFAALAVCGCPQQKAQRVASYAGASPNDARKSALSDFDELITAASVFEGPAQMEQYELSPVTEDRGRRSYVFSLRQHPGMIKNRHFHLISVAVTRMLGTTDAGNYVAGTGGPNGGFVE